jgi:hypothetical protein
VNVNELFDACREVNQYAGWLSFLWLTYRTVRAWPAEWAKPEHVSHYRMLLCITSGLLLSVTYGSYWYETHQDSPAGPASLAILGLIIATLVLCAAWPESFWARGLRRRDNQAH